MMLTAAFLFVRRNVCITLGPALATFPYLPDFATRIRRRLTDASLVSSNIDFLTSHAPQRLARVAVLKASQGTSGLSPGLVAHLNSFEAERERHLELMHFQQHQFDRRWFLDMWSPADQTALDRDMEGVRAFEHNIYVVWTAMITWSRDNRS